MSMINKINISFEIDRVDTLINIAKKHLKDTKISNFESDRNLVYFNLFLKEIIEKKCITIGGKSDFCIWGGDLNCVDIEDFYKFSENFFEELYIEKVIDKSYSNIIIIFAVEDNNRECEEFPPTFYEISYDEKTNKLKKIEGVCPFYWGK